MIQRLITITLLLSSLFLAACQSGPGPYDELAQCLTENEVVFYGTEWCPHCQDQKKIFGNSMEYIDFVDCDKYRDECLAAGVQAYPTWTVFNQNYEGVQQPERLARLAGCPTA